MRKLFLVFMLAVFACPAMAIVADFSINSITEQTLVSHQRIRFTINTGASYFPYTGMVGWRLLFSRYEIGESDPQYEYAVWSLPAQGADLSQEIWIVRPEGLDGLWHCRIDAVDADRKPVATSHEFTHEFSQPDNVYRDILPYVSTVSPWVVSVGVTNPAEVSAKLRIYVYDTAGDPYPINHGTNVMEVAIPAHGSWAVYADTVVGYGKNFYGHFEFESDQPMQWMAVIGTTSDPAKTIFNGRLE